MKYTAQVIYSDFTEVFEVDLEEKKLDIKLSQISERPLTDKDILTLDLNTDIKTSYSDFPFDAGDLTIIQSKDTFVVSCYVKGEIKWLKFTAADLIDYLFRNDITNQIIPYTSEDKALLLNAVLSDMVRNDFSFSDLNKKVKYVKVAVLLSFIHQALPFEFKRIILDETVLGDVDVDHIALAFRFSEQKFLKLIKINNLAKIIVLFEKNKVLPKGYTFVEHVFFINNPNHGEKLKLVFGDTGIKFDYQVLPTKNYVFDLGDKQYQMNVGNMFKENVKGKVFVFNGDERDLMVS
jgi:regulation of enolase protein 1 (concanavalin A-like superfamily)